MEISNRRVLRLTLALGAAGTLAVLARLGARDAIGFAAGAAISYVSYLSWTRLAASIGASGKAPAMGSAVFLALRYVLIGVAIYVIIEFLRSTPGVLIVGLLSSFAALILELLWGALGPK
ncbi:MAG TPA: hypothetical protein VMT15_15830 [Bryobacteraceae bacterium]|nr:hypothetical protein [Bryobacteraceae bacterium]